MTREELEKNWGVPDWRDENAYPKANELNLTKWAWEFLRRNHDYRKFWQDEWAPFYSTNGFDSGKCRAAQGWSYDRVDKEKFDGYEDPVTKCQEQFGLIGGPNDPHVSNSHVFLEPMGLRLHRCHRNPEHKINHKEVAISFNLEWPIEYQIKSAREYLNERKKSRAEKNLIKPKEIRSHVQHFPTYLRLLDAHDAMADLAEMSKSLYPEILNFKTSYPGSKKASLASKRARQLRDYGYRFISAIS